MRYTFFFFFGSLVLISNVAAQSHRGLYTAAEENTQIHVELRDSLRARLEYRESKEMQEVRCTYSVQNDKIQIGVCDQIRAVSPHARIDTTFTADSTSEKRELTNRLSNEVFNIGGSKLVEGAIVVDLNGHQIRLVKRQ